MNVEDLVLRDLHRAASDAGRPKVAMPSIDLPELTGSDPVARARVAQALHRLTRDGRATRVRRDLLVLPDSRGLLGLDLVDLLGFVVDGPYLITAGRALEYAELTDQHYFGLVVLTAAPTSPLQWRGQTATFRPTEPTNIWGAVPGAEVPYALPERALLDVLSHPRYGVSLDQAVAVLKRAVAADDAFLQSLLQAVVRYGSGVRQHGARASARRVGCLVDRLFGTDAAAPYLPLIGDNWAPVLLRPGGRSTGELDRTWRVMVNATIETEMVW